MPSTRTAAIAAEPMDQIMKVCNEMGMMTNEAMNAALESASVLTKGCNEMYQSFTTLMQNALTQSTEVGKAMMGARTMSDLMDTQSSLMKEGFEFAMNEASKFTQISARTAQQACAPVANHMQATMGKITKMKAA